MSDSDQAWGQSTGSLIQGWNPASGDLSSREIRRSRHRSASFDFFLADPLAVAETTGPLRPAAETVARSVGLSPSEDVLFPSADDVVGGFRIVSELGRGAFARVFLAEQTDLARRHVALKIAEALGEEPQALARLQHTHIVPIHSVHDDPETGLRILCMPYHGGANLAQVLERSGAHLPTQASGKSLIDALDLVRTRTPMPPSVTRGPASYRGSMTREIGRPTVARSILGRYLAKMTWWQRLEDDAMAEIGLDPTDTDRDQPARQFLRSHTYVQASAWIAARLAEGLEHAHARGILHRDLKPSNILIADDGTPMLLDFNLSADSDMTTISDEKARAMLGGTLPYMAPEHLDAFNPRGDTQPRAVDERSDLYSLGLILFEMLAGHHAFEDPPAGPRIIELIERMTADRRAGAPSVRASNPTVPPSLDAIVAKCLRPDPDARYARAADLAEDLNRHLADRPNRHAPEPSLRERTTKWWRRHPQVRGAGPMAALAACVLISVALTAWSIRDSAQGALARVVWREFRDRFERCQLWLNTASGPASHRARGLVLAAQTLEAYHVKGAEDWTESALYRRLPPADRLTLREELAELLLLEARARVAEVSRSASEPERRKALEEAVSNLTRAERIDPHPSAALFEDRSRYRAALGEADGSRADLVRASNHPPSLARDFYLRGTQRAARGEIDQAEADLGRAVALDPKRFWAWFVLGLCHFDRGRFADAVGDFNACTLLAPEFAWPHLNRGLALASAGRLNEARVSYDRALTISPDFVEARIDRALTCLELGDPEQAERDLSRAIALGRRDAAILAARAESLCRMGRREQAELDFAEILRVRPHDPAVRVARGFSRIGVDPIGAEVDFRDVLDRQPRHGRALLGMARLQMPDLVAAGHYLDLALDAEPGLTDARQLRALVRARSGNPSAVIDVDRLEQSPSAHNLYNAACSLAILGRFHRDPATGNRAMDLLRRSLAAGFPASHAAEDEDLSLLRSRSDFANLIAARR